MRPFDYARATSVCDAFELTAARPGAVFVAGGTDLLPLWNDAVCAPPAVIDISRLSLDAVEVRDSEIAIGALARMSDVADHPMIGAATPAIADALCASASGQLRNAASVGGNLLQRTRCSYFRNVGFPCNKRAPGSGCAALGGDDRRHAIFGASEHCTATHASDLAVALVALDATVDVLGPGGSGDAGSDRAVAIADFFVMPGDRPDRETVLRPGELIGAIRVPRTALAQRSRYLKVRDRASFDFAVVSVAAALHIEDGVVREARLAAGGVGTTPWRLRGSEQALAGARSGEQAFSEAAARATDGARPLGHNGFKLELLRRCVRRVLDDLAGGA
jgi:xanthine dehydrogenase YagS FAD-binding subunit